MMANNNNINSALPLVDGIHYYGDGTEQSTTINNARRARSEKRGGASEHKQWKRKHPNDVIDAGVGNVRAQPPLSIPSSTLMLASSSTTPRMTTPSKRYGSVLMIPTLTATQKTATTTITGADHDVDILEYNRHAHNSTIYAIDKKQQNYPNVTKNKSTETAGMMNQRKICFCNYGPSICEFENACIKHEKAACFHAVKQEFNEHLGRLELQHMYGCAPLERGSEGSHFTCNAWRSIHSAPRSIACCYAGNNCNQNLSIPQFPLLERNGDTHFKPTNYHHPSGLEAIAFLCLGSLVGLLLILLIGFPLFYLYRKGKARTLFGCFQKMVTDDADVAVDSNDNNLERGALLDADDSGSGSGGITLNQRTIAQNLQMLEVFARGRYGELRKAVYRGSLVAVKIFYTTEEQSWRNEREIYLSQMLNHENILQYVAADIMSSVESLTQMMLITDYHPFGSLYDYLRADFPLSLQEALELALSICSGLEHLHNPVRGTGGRRKPEIAHRDIKSKNVLIKRPGVCCLADFGLAVRIDDCSGCSEQQQQKQQIVPQPVNIQVGTKRYMAPELLSRSLNVEHFEEFKCADIYSFSLVLWEIVNCIEMLTTVDGTAIAMMTPRGRTTMAAMTQQPRQMSHSNSSGIATGSDPIAATTTYEFAIPTSIGSSPLLLEKSPDAIAMVKKTTVSCNKNKTVINNNDSRNNKYNNYMADQSLAPLVLSSPTSTSSSSSASSLPATGGATSVGTTNAKCSQRSSNLCVETTNTDSANDNRTENNKEPNEDSTQIRRQMSQHRSHMLPYQMIVETDPSFEQMREIVCDKKHRPPIELAWNDESVNPLLKILCELMAECWSERPRSRHTALKMKKELARLVIMLQQQQQT